MGIICFNANLSIFQVTYAILSKGIARALPKNPLRAESPAGTFRVTSWRHVIVGGHLGPPHYSRQVPGSNSGRVKARWPGSRPARTRWRVSAGSKCPDNLLWNGSQADGRTTGIASMRQRDAVPPVRRLRRRPDVRAKENFPGSTQQLRCDTRWMDACGSARQGHPAGIPTCHGCDKKKPPSFASEGVVRPEGSRQARPTW